MQCNFGIGAAEKRHANSLTDDGIHIIQWSMIETSVSIIAASLPLLMPLFRRGHGFHRAFTATKSALDKFGFWSAKRDGKATSLASDVNYESELSMGSK